MNVGRTGLVEVGGKGVEGVGGRETALGKEEEKKVEMRGKQRKEKEEMKKRS